jgi:hypothetical protein
MAHPPTIGRHQQNDRPVAPDMGQLRSGSIIATILGATSPFAACD